ncbi:hypothetical protein [Haloarcula sediminis]|uniref:hypothetical protein n=1 Tax=Haloarcula sediminis TaxID=3111777 RepID=UPI002D7765E6|nr:hypothetical protein [Haloarcula sp. CK38]
MGVRNTLMGSTSMNNEVDLIDMGALILLPLFSSLIFGVFSWQIEVFGGYDFTAALWTVGGAGISVALLVVLAGVAWIGFTNFANSKTDMSDGEKAAIGTALLLPVLYVFVPVVADLVTWHDMMRLVATLYVSAAAVYISYVG